MTNEDLCFYPSLVARGYLQFPMNLKIASAKHNREKKTQQVYLQSKCSSFLYFFFFLLKKTTYNWYYGQVLAMLWRTPPIKREPNAPTRNNFSF